MNWWEIVAICVPSIFGIYIACCTVFDRTGSRQIERDWSYLSTPLPPVVNPPPYPPRDNSGGIIEHYTMRGGTRVRDTVINLGAATDAFTDSMRQAQASVVSFNRALSNAEIAGISQLMREGVVTPAEIREAVTYRGRLITDEQRAMILANTLPSTPVIVPAREPEPVSTVAENRRLEIYHNE